MPVQNSNSKISARPDIATQLLQIIILITFDSLLCQKSNLHFSLVLEGLLGKYLAINKVKTELNIFHRNIFLSKIEVFR